MPSVNDGFSYSDFTNKQDFTNKINGKGQPDGYVLTTNGTKSYWAQVGGGGSGLQGIQGIQGIKGATGNDGIQGIQGISGGGGGSYYYPCRYDDLTNYNTPIEINSLHDHACQCTYTDEIIESKGEVNNVNLRDVTLTPVTTTCPNGNMVVDERSPFAFGTCFTETYIDRGTLNGRDLSAYPIAALYWKPNSTSRSYTYFKEGESGGGVGGVGSYVNHGASILYINHHDASETPMFVLGIDLDWTRKNEGDWNFSRAMQSDHYLLFDNQDGLGVDAWSFICPKIFIRNVIQNPVLCPGFHYSSGNNYIMDPYKNVKFTAMDNNFVIETHTMMLFHLCIRRFPYLAPENIDRDTYMNRYNDCGGNPDETNDPKTICDTLFVSLDWTPYKAKDLMALSDSTASGYEEGTFYIGNNPYHID